MARHAIKARHQGKMAKDGKARTQDKHCRTAEAAEWRSIVIQILKECKDAQLRKFLSKFKNLH